MKTALYTIEICMGSSCFARGNRESLGIIESFLKTHKLLDRVELKGSLCMECCGNGPHVTINNTSYKGVRPAEMGSILERELYQ